MSTTRRGDAPQPCYLPARVIEERDGYPAVVTRIGTYRAHLSGDLPLAADAHSVLELDRPTDGERVQVGVRVVRVHREGAQWGWKPAFIVELLDRLDTLAPLGDVSFESRSGVDPVAVRSLSLSLDDGSEDFITFESGDASMHSWISMDDGHHLARGLVDPDAARTFQVGSATSESLPGMSLPRRSSAGTPWSAPPASEHPYVEREARVLSNFPVAYMHAGEHRGGTAQDFSRHGLFLAVMPADPVPPLEAVLRVEFPVPLEGTTYIVGLMAEVRWSHGADDANAVGRGVGLQVLTFDRAEGRRIYERYVQSLVEAASG